MKLSGVLGYTLLLVGILLLYFAIQSANVSVDVLTENGAGSHASNTMFLLISGGITLIISLVLLAYNKNL